MEGELIKVGTEVNSDMEKMEKDLEFVTDSPNVTVATRKYLSGEREDGSNCVVFGFGCVRHSHNNFVEDLCTHRTVKLTLS